MKDLVEKIRRIVLQKLMPNDLSIKHRLCNLIYATTLLGSVLTLLISIFITPSVLTLLTICAAIVVISISLYLSVHKRKHTVAALIIILFIDEIIFPIMYYANGGIRSGMQMWFVLGLMFTFLVLDGKLVALTFILGSLTLGSCFMLEMAGYIHPPQLEDYTWAADVIQSMVLVALIFGIFFQLQTYIYTKQNKALMEKEEVILRAMQEVGEANKAKSLFLANMSHEIRTPINAIMGMNELILRDSEEEATIQNADRIRDASHSLLELVNNILDISKIESGNMEVINDDYKLSDMLNECYNIIYLRAQNKGLEFKIVNDPMIPDELNGDKFHIFQIVSNLLTNAVKYTKEGQIELSVNFEEVAPDKINLIMAVKDSGIGIAKDDIDKLFIDFQRIDIKKNRTIEGTGLGLAIVAKLLELMGGKIEVDSELGKGTTFTAVIPQIVSGQEKLGDFDKKYEERTKNSGKEYKVKFRAPTARILAVDDVAINLLVVQGLLKRTEARVDIALSGAEALELTDENKYDVIFMDHMMPEMDGIETLHALKERKNRNFDTPVVALTANAIKGAEEEYLEAGFDNYMSKPVDGTNLEKMVMYYLPAAKMKDWTI